MATTAARITDDASYQPFFYLKITGFPYYFFATVDPTSTTYGSDAWTLGTGYSAIRGLRLPDDSMQQSLGDVVGGIATSERLRLVLQDFDVTDTTVGTTYKFFGRLFSPGRALTAAGEQIGFLDADLSASTGGGSTFTATGPDTYAATGNVYVGGETIQYSARATVSNQTTFTIGNRNLWPAYTNPATPSITYPPTPYYRVYKPTSGGAATSTLSAQTPVTSVPLMIVGRTAAFYVGHLRPNGQPETEANSAVRMVGRIKSINYEGGLFTLELESIVDDLQTAHAAPGLALAQVQNYISTMPAEWSRFILGCRAIDVADGTSKPFEKSIAITPAYFTGDGAVANLCGKINVAIAAIPMAGSTYQKKMIARIKSVRCDPQSYDGNTYVRFRAHRFADVDNNYEWYVQHSNASGFAAGVTLQGSLLCALGFPWGGGPYVFTTPDTYALVGDAGDDSKWRYVQGPSPAASVFIPTSSYTSQVVNLDSVTEGAPGSRFFSDQGDGSGSAWVRFGNGDINKLTAKTATTLTITHGHATSRRYFFSSLFGIVEGPRYYYVPRGESGTVEQVVATPDATGAALTTAPLALCARLLCSDWNSTTDGEYDVFPEGVGLGWNAFVDKAPFRAGLDIVGTRFFIVDRETLWKDVFTPLAREFHLYLVWSPADGQITLRRLVIPTAAAAATFQFTESNRPRETDTTQSDQDFAMMRTGWRIKYAWSHLAKKFTSEVGYTDGWATNAYGVDNKSETIEDRSIYEPDDAGATLVSIVANSMPFRYPWMRYSRSVNKTGLLLSPGTVHKIIDATVHQPYTGTFGIVSADAVYGFLTSVDANAATGEVKVEYIVASTEQSGYRPWSPCARVDFNATGQGWVAGTKTLTLLRHYTANADASTYDGIDFTAGDKVRLVTRDNDGGPTQMNDDTIASVSADGLTVVLTTGFASLNSSVETVMTLQRYTSATATQQAAYSFQGDASVGTIQATARVHRFQ